MNNKSNKNGIKPSRNNHHHEQTNGHTKRRRGNKNKQKNNNNNNNNRISYASRISTKSGQHNNQRKLSVRSNDSSPYEIDNNNYNNPPCIHIGLTLKELLRIKMIQKNICYVAGLPKHLCRRNILSSTEWFGKFGKIRDISITDNQNCIRTNWMCVHIKYISNISATNAVNEYNNKKLINLGITKPLQANYGTQRYCEYFLNKKKCLKSNCPFRHYWCKKDEIVNFNHHNKYNKTSYHTPVHPPVNNVNNNNNNINNYYDYYIGGGHSDNMTKLTPKHSINSMNMNKSPSIPSNSISSKSQSPSNNNNNNVNIIRPAPLTATVTQPVPVTQPAPVPVTVTNDYNINISDVDITDIISSDKQVINNNNSVSDPISRISSLELQLRTTKSSLLSSTLEISKLQKFSQHLVDHCHSLENKLRELEYHNNELDEKFKDLNKKYKILRDCDYFKWNDNDVYEWIICVNNNQFNKYKKELFKNIKLENINGNCLKMLDKNDLHRCGIKDFKDKNDLIQIIKKLKKKPIP